MKPISNFKSSRPRGDVQLDLSVFMCSVSCNDLLYIYQFSRKQFNVLYQNAQSMTAEVWETLGLGGRLAPWGIGWLK